ncbi:putative manganese transporter [Methanosarcina sp. UBA5]|uniref:putative manganese transporter n=1 Tax=Methanosarcina sp. UBA5 TaxID=1915593 RepID=UPI0025E38443|nr:putative manganese transporter [Methanosarcina sp. UBA5]
MELAYLFDIFLDALTDSAKMIPLLFIIFVGIELVEYKYANNIREAVQKAGVFGPAIGAVTGSFPQCGISVVASALYTQRLITIGTLLAVYLSTSDEAIPVILSQPEKAKIIVPFIITKIIIALIGGYAVDFAFRESNKKTLVHIKAYAEGHDNEYHNHETILEEKACCGHSASPSSIEFNPKEIILHPIIHTVKVFIFIFSVSFAISYVIAQMGEETLEKMFLMHSVFQPFLVALFGLIPNCAASVAITMLYLKGVITYGSVIAGLCTSGGLGLLVLFKEEKDKKDVLIILLLLFGISVLAGYIIQYI